MPQAYPDRLARKANQLYWESSRPAGQLAAELGVSRSKFYAIIEPLELENRCEVCKGNLVFGSRTDREAGRARCLECGSSYEVTLEPAAPETAPVEEPAAGKGAAPSRELVPRAGPELDSRDIWLTAACGMVVGLLAFVWFRRR